jgi:hypothetical protein
MMGGVSPKTCWASYKYGIIKFWYTVASCRIFLYELYYDARIHKHQVVYSAVSDGLLNTLEDYWGLLLTTVQWIFIQPAFIVLHLYKCMFHENIVEVTATTVACLKFKVYLCWNSRTQDWKHTTLVMLWTACFPAPHHCAAEVLYIISLHAQSD